MFNVKISDSNQAMSEERRMELEEALEMALEIMSGGGVDREDWANLAGALEAARGI